LFGTYDFYESMISKSNYMQLCIEQKYGPKDMGCELFMYFLFWCLGLEFFGHFKMEIS
jgi:hypothetical protein